jgi:hypothetical protein
MDSIEFVNWVWCVWKWGLDTPNISQVLKDRWWLTTELWEFLIFRQTHWLTSANSLHLFFPGWQIVGMGWKRHSWQHPAPSVVIVSSTFHLDHVGRPQICKHWILRCIGHTAHTRWSACLVMDSCWTRWTVSWGKISCPEHPFRCCECWWARLDLCVARLECNGTSGEDEMEPYGTIQNYDVWCLQSK